MVNIFSLTRKVFKLSHRLQLEMLVFNASGRLAEPNKLTFIFNLLCFHLHFDKVFKLILRRKLLYNVYHPNKRERTIISLNKNKTTS